MRNGQNKRMRGRNNNRGHSNNNNNNRGNHHNPLTRVYESNGPEVKIRGTAHHVAEKYLQLARDASSSGDPVTAEGHYQHAEHYLRLIAAAQEQFRQQNPYYQAPPAPGENVNDGTFEDGDDDGQQQPQQGQQGQPNFGNQQANPNQQPYSPREQQHQQPGYSQQPQHRPQQHQPQQHQPQQQPNYQPQYQQPQPTFEGNNGLPSFITGGQPQQNAQGEATNDRDGGHDNGRDNGQPGGDRFPRRRRRHPRGPRPDMAGAAQGGDQPPGE